MDTPDAEPPLRRSLRAAVVLAAAAVAAVGLVAVVHDLARPRIEANQRAERLAKLTAALGDVVYDNDPLTDVIFVRDAELLGTDEPVPVHRARRASLPAAALITAVAPDGYSGSIRLLVAVGADGRLLGVRILSHNETPGLGDAIEERRTPWIRMFEDRALGDPPLERWKVRKDGGHFDQLTGATVSSRAVVQAVRNVLVWHERQRRLLYEAPSADDRSHKMPP